MCHDVYHQNTADMANEWQDIKTFQLADILIQILHQSQMTRFSCLNLKTNTLSTQFQQHSRKFSTVITIEQKRTIMDYRQNQLEMTWVD